MINKKPVDTAPDAIKALKTIPGVGNSIAADLTALDIHRVSDLVGKEPEALYTRLCAIKGCKLDGCLLYVFRCAVYFAETPTPDPEKLKWWNWKN